MIFHLCGTSICGMSSTNECVCCLQMGDHFKGTWTNFPTGETLLAYIWVITTEEKSPQNSQTFMFCWALPTLYSVRLHVYDMFSTSGIYWNRCASVPRGRCVIQVTILHPKYMDNNVVCSAHSWEPGQMKASSEIKSSRQIGVDTQYYKK